MLTYEEARHKVIEIAGSRAGEPAREQAGLREALGRVLAECILADRDYPPFDRSTRDGFAVRSADVAASGSTLEIIGEIKAGDEFAATVGAHQCVAIMTGAAVPKGADAVVMLEHTRPDGAASDPPRNLPSPSLKSSEPVPRPNQRVVVDRPVERGQNIVVRGSEARAEQAVLRPGTRLGYTEVALAAQVGRRSVDVFRRPRLAVISTGDEVVSVETKPGPFHIRNSNDVSVAAQAAMAGAEPFPLGNVPDRIAELRAVIERGLTADMVVVSGGVSMGKYDLVEQVLGELGVEVFFDAVAIRPGRPAVFGVCRGKLVFGLPGNPVSTLVTFELFVLPAIDLLSGAKPRPLPLFRAKLASPVVQKAPLTHFLPARVSWTTGEPLAEELPWQGSGDLVALAQANCFLVVPQTKLVHAAGEWIEVLPLRGIF